MMEKTKKCKPFTWAEKLANVRKNITVEPIMLCYIIPSFFASLATQNLNLEKACRVNLAYSNTICDSLTRRDTANFTQEERTVQQLVTGMAAWKMVLISGLPCLLMLFYGSWSDRHGRRKPCILIPIVGELTRALGLILCTYFENTPMEVAGVTEALFPGLTGGWLTLLMGAYSYVADVTTEEERTLRVGIVNVCFSLGIPIGMAFSGISLKRIGFYGVFSISAFFYVCALTYGLVFLPEPAVPRNRSELIESKSTTRSKIADFFDKKHVVETFQTGFKQGANQRRLRVIMLMIAVMVVIGPLHGELSMIYLFTRYQFNWSEVEFSIFSTYGMMTGLVGASFAVGVLSHLLKIDDSLIGVMACMSKILSSFVYSFAVTEWQLYLAPLVDFLNTTSLTAMRSIASKLVTSDELGKINSLFGVADALTSLIYASMYASVYQATIGTLPGAFFLVGGALTFPAVIIFLWMYKMHRRDLQPKANLATNDSGDCVNTAVISSNDKKDVKNDLGTVPVGDNPTVESRSGSVPVTNEKSPIITFSNQLE